MTDIRNLLRRLTRSETAWGICAGILFGVAVLAGTATLNAARLDTSATSGWHSTRAPAASQARPHFANFGDTEASDAVYYIVNWIMDSNDARGNSFVIVDKKDAKVYVFASNGTLHGMTPVLLGSAPGDDSVAGIGLKPIDDVRPEERTTPAGRFVGQRGYNARGEDVVWIDYDAAVSMHRVLTTHPEEKRLERLESPASEDNRISYGCINVPVVFFESLLQPAFAGRQAIVYVLPETKPIDQVFGSYKVALVHGPLPTPGRQPPKPPGLGNDTPLTLRLALQPK